MKVVKTSGTLGDAFIIVCKLYGKGVSLTEHYTKHENMYDVIREIFSLINVDVIKGKKSSMSIVGDIKKNDTYVENPKFDLPNVDRFKLPNKYSVLQMKSGASNTQTWRKLNVKDVKGLKGDIVLIGTDNEPINIPNVIDLRNKCTLLESFKVIANSEHFYGPQGLLSYFALSQNVCSDVFLKSKVDKHAVEHRINKINKWKQNVKYHCD